MKLSTKGRYGLRAVIDMAEQGDSEVVSLASIAARQGLSERYLEQIIRLLKKDGLVSSERGATGGYKLTRPASQISVGDILRTLEGNLDVVSCSAKGDVPCGGADKCVAKNVWKCINTAIQQAVDGIMLDSLARQSREVHEGDNSKAE